MYIYWTGNKSTWLLKLLIPGGHVLNTIIQSGSLNGTKYLCHLCPSEFTAKASLRDHVISFHMGEKRFKCNVCDKTFFRKNKLLQHMDGHAVDKMHVCHVCGNLYTYVYVITYNFSLILSWGVSCQAQKFIAQILRLRDSFLVFSLGDTSKTIRCSPKSTFLRNVRKIINKTEIWLICDWKT